jgi:phage baseplate assembly protein W
VTTPLPATAPKDFLGVGWKFPIQVDSNLMIRMSKHEEDIKEAIWIILATSKGERVMQPDFGCGIHDFVFESISSTTRGLIEQTVRDALILWEPRITLVKVSASTDQIDEGKLIINIDYIVNSTNNRFNLVYPFYLQEGG